MILGRTRAPLPWFEGQHRSTRLRVALRWYTCPIERIATLLPTAGKVLDWGCGHGLLALEVARSADEVRVDGRDIDDQKIASAGAAARTAGVAARVTFRVVEIADAPSGTWDGVVMNDVLYLQTPADRERLVRAGAAALAPGGVLVCKELARTPVWKWTACLVQEQVSVRLLRVTHPGSGLGEPPDPDEVAGWMRDAGLVVEQVPMGRGYHAPHVAIVGRRGGAVARSEQAGRSRARGGAAGRLPL